MEKILKVSNVPQGKGYVPAIRIAGNYLTDLNFSLDDAVFVDCKKNCIVIKKASKKELIKRMAIKNPSLLTLINTFDLTV